MKICSVESLTTLFGEFSFPEEKKHLICCAHENDQVADRKYSARFEKHSFSFESKLKFMSSFGFVYKIVKSLINNF